MARKRTLVFVRYAQADLNETAEMVPLGSRSQVRSALAAYNTAPDGAAQTRLGTEILHGPGIVVEIPTVQDEVNQAMVTVVDEDIAWPVLLRICRSLDWRMMDTESGRMFGG